MSNPNGLLTEANHDQEKLLNLAFKHADAAKVVLDHAAKFDELYQPTLAAMRLSESQGCRLTRQTHRDYMETVEKMIPADVAAKMTVFNRCSIRVVKRHDLPGLMLQLDAIGKRRTNAAACEMAKAKMNAGDGEGAVAALKSVGADTAKLETALVQNGKMPLRCNVVKASNVDERSMRWLWPQRVPLGKLTLLFGMGNLGKSMITTDIAARVSMGAEWPDGSVGEKGGVLFITAEDDLHDTVVPRLRAAGADLDAIGLLQTVQVLSKDGKVGEKGFTLKDLPQLEQNLKEGQYRLVIIDPIGAFLDGTDSHKDSDIRQLLTPLKQVAEKYAVTMLLVGHANKGKGMRAAQRIMGSQGFSNACRAAYMVMEDGKDLERRLMLPTKLNLAKQQGGLAYRIVASDVDALDGSPLPKVDWLGDVQTTADEALAATEDMTFGQRDDAKAFLQNALADGPKSAMEVTADAAARGISERTLARAKDELCVISNRRGGGRGGFGGSGGKWEWSLPNRLPSSDAADARAF